jgi:hypothetical protein
MLDLYGIEDVIDGCAYLVFLNELYEYAGHNTDGKMIFKNTNHTKKTMVVGYDELIKSRDLFEIAY